MFNDRITVLLLAALEEESKINYNLATSVIDKVKQYGYKEALKHTSKSEKALYTKAYKRIEKHL